MSKTAPYSAKRDGEKWMIAFNGEKIVGDLTLEQAMDGCARFNTKWLNQQKGSKRKK